MVPIIIWATGIISKSFRKYLNNVPRKNDVTELQKRGIPGTAHVRWNALI